MFLQNSVNSAIIFPMEVSNEESRQSLEPLFLSQAQASGITLRIAQMNKTEHEGVIRDVGRYELNLEKNGRLVTLLKREISSLTAPGPVLAPPFPRQARVSADQTAPDAAQPRPNIQQEFLDKAVKENQLLTLYLVNGQRIKASIAAYDSFTILFNEGGRQHLYYKHSISTINR
jgi:host factor-I protein